MRRPATLPAKESSSEVSFCAASRITSDRRGQIQRDKAGCEHPADPRVAAVLCGEGVSRAVVRRGIPGWFCLGPSCRRLSNVSGRVRTGLGTGQVLRADAALGDWWPEEAGGRAQGHSLCTGPCTLPRCASSSGSSVSTGRLRGLLSADARPLSSSAQIAG